jgi:hypothetical protein
MPICLKWRRGAGPPKGAGMFAVAQTRNWFWRIVVLTRASLSLCLFNKGMATGNPEPPAGNARAPNNFLIH